MRLMQPRGDPPIAAPSQAVLAALALHSPSDLQDLLAALLLSEVVYKRRQQASVALEAYAAALPVPVALSSVHYSRRSLAHPYMLACGDSCLYMCCRGTKELRDFLADGNLILQELEWQESTLVHDSSSDASASAALPAVQSRPAAHRGFLSRAAGIPIEALYAHARTRGQRLCICGHSLGGAVAVLCTIRLLKALGPHVPPTDVLRCITFGMPPLGNLALVQHVHANGWVRFITNYALPEDMVPRLLLQDQRQQLQHASQPAPTQAALAGMAAEPAVQQLLQQETGSGSSTTSVSTTAAMHPGWAASTAQALASAARSAAALLPAVPSFLHLGQQLFVLPDRVTSSLPPGRPQMPAGGQQQKQLRVVLAQPLVGLHSMASYRARVVSVSQHALDQAGESPAQPPALSLAIQRLAPAVVVELAVARLPLLPPQLLPPVTRAPQHAVMSVEVRGKGLEIVTSAALQVPGATAAIEADAVTNSAKAELLAQLRALGGLAATSSSGGKTGSRWLARLRRRPSTAMGSGSAAPGFVAQFTMPSALLHSLQLSPDGRLPALTLLLQTDFEQQTISVGLECMVAWLLGTNAELSTATWHGLEHARMEEQGQAAQQRHWLPTRVASLPSSIVSQVRGSVASSGAAWLGRTVPMWQQREQRGGIPDELQQQQAEQQQPPGATWWSARLASIHALYMLRVAPALTTLSRRLGLASTLPGVAPLPSALALGMLLLDASALTAGTRGGVPKQLELAAEVVRWESHRAQKFRWRHSCGGSKADDAWLGDEGLALEGELGLAARLRRQLAAASGAVQRRAVLLGHAQSLQAALTPALLVITLWQKQLDASSIDALQRLAAACRASDLGLLLAVAALQPLSTVYREHLALSVGLKESAVVPLVAERDGGTLRLRVQTLRAAMVACAAQQQPQARL